MNAKQKQMSWRETLQLPKTDFPMKANLEQREPSWLKEWHQSKLDKTIVRISESRAKKFLLHDGPPYANGALHMGHALNKILKDIINRTRFMEGWGIDYRPGWDCHGLPIEWQVEKKLRQKKQGAQLMIDPVRLRSLCRAHAEEWMAKQKEEFMRLGVHGKWDNPYSTMTPASEAAIRAELSTILLQGGLKRAIRPVLWSVVEQTALAEAEVLHPEHESHSITVAFALIKAQDERLKECIIPVWTTTPWTLPANVALACGADINYSLINLTVNDKRQNYLIAHNRMEDFIAKMQADKHEILASFTGAQLAGSVSRHPLHGQGFDHEPCLYDADFVSDDVGTGFVHIAPAHGMDDFQLGKDKNLPLKECVAPNGMYDEKTPLLAGIHIFKADELIVQKMKEQGTLLHHGKLRHKYPHSWRSKKPLIYRATAQWFIPMSHKNVRAKALAELKAISFYPAKGKQRLTTMIEGRPDWCVSRQRRWGVPLALFVHKETKEPIIDEELETNILRAFKKNGSDCWYAQDPKQFLPKQYNPDEYDPLMDILDVWFDSGASHAFVLGGEKASLYLEGSDQHRGWFQSSLLESVVTRGRAPYEAVLTHGFVLDAKGYKMSKSNKEGGIFPRDLMKTLGADILRLWVAMSDVSEDLRIGDEILSYHKESYRRMRNCLRFMLGVLHHHADGELPAPSNLHPLERWLLHRVSALHLLHEKMSARYQFTAFYTELHNFCANDLSSFYLDIRKDVFYCEGEDSKIRRDALAVLSYCFECLCAWLAPVLVFTSDEAWRVRLAQKQMPYQNIHTRKFVSRRDFYDEDIEDAWRLIKQARREVTSTLEEARAQGAIRSNLEARVRLEVGEEIMALLKKYAIDMTELTLTAQCEVTLAANDEMKAHFIPCEWQKCARCWRHQEHLETYEQDMLCARCVSVVKALP